MTANLPATDCWRTIVQQSDWWKCEECLAYTTSLYNVWQTMWDGVNIHFAAKKCKWFFNRDRTRSVEYASAQSPCITQYLYLMHKLITYKLLCQQDATVTFCILLFLDNVKISMYKIFISSDMYIFFNICNS